MEGLVFCAGNPLLDISAEVGQEFLDKYGLKPANAILAEPQHLPLYEELVNNYSVEYIAGGAGQNTIRSLQWMRQVPGLTTYVGSVGTDKYGELLEAQASKDGVRVMYQKTGEHPTGTCAALIHQRERSLVANLAAANHYKKDHFETEEVQLWLNKAKFFYCSSFFLTVSPETVVEIGKHAHANDKHLTINLAAPFLIDFFFDQLSSVMPYADMIVGNEHEGLAIGRKLGWGEDLKVIAEKLGTYEKKSERPRIAIITQGDKETIVYHEGQIKEFPPSTIPTEEIVDLNGAGDCFIGGFLSAFTQGKDIDECIAAGHYCAGVIIKRSGITFPDAPDFSYSSH